MRHFVRLAKAIRHLGILNGTYVFLLYVFHRLFKRRTWDTRQVRISILPRKIWMRPGVSDWILLERIFFDKEYDCRSVSHDDFMNKLESEIVSRGKQPLIIDCGANIGLSSIWLSERFQRSIVLSIEPEPSNFRLLELNAKNYQRIQPLNVAISDHISRVSLNNDSDVPWAWRTMETNAAGVQALTIDHLLSSHQDCVLMAVKMDIEGFEVNVFRDGARWVDALPLLIFEMHDWMVPWSSSGHSFFSALSRQRRDYLIQGENMFSYSHKAAGRSEICEETSSVVQ